MKIVEIKLERVYNLGNYESERISLTAQIDETEDELTALSVLKQRLELMRTKKV